MTVLRNLVGFRLTEIQFGDTLQSIAARELADASRWAQLIDINGLEFPYLTGNPVIASPTVKLYGDLLIVPAGAAQVTAVIDPDRLFGVDLDLTGGVLSAVNGDFALIAGRQNLYQAIKNRIMTSLGELLFHLDYGCGISRLKGTDNGPTAAILAAQYVRSALASDGRIDQVASSVATVTGDVISIESTVIPIVGTSMDVSAVI